MAEYNREQKEGTELSQQGRARMSGRAFQTRIGTVLFYGVHIAVSLLIGLLIYLLYRPDTYLAMYLRLPTWISTHLSLTSAPGLVWLLKNYIPDGLWAYALAFSITAILRPKGNRWWMVIGTCFLFETLMECLQLTSYIPGTFDLWDILTEFIATGCAILIIIMHERKKENDKSSKNDLLILVLVLFAVMAMGSGSKSSETPAASAEGNAAPATSPAEETSKPAAEPTAAPAPTEAAGKAEYEVGEGRANVYKNSIDTVWVQVSVPVINTGSADLYLSSCTVDLEDADGHLVNSLPMVSAYPEVLRPGETGWYYEETTLDEEPASALKVIQHVDVKPAKVECIRFDVSDVTISDDTYGGLKIVGRVENGSTKDASLVYVVFFLYDDQDELLATAFTIMTDDLKAGDKVGFSLSTFSAPEDVKADKVSRYEVYAYPNQFQIG